MGGSKSIPLDESRISEIATEASGAFIKDFPAAYKDVLIRAAKSGNDPLGVKNHLLTAPAPKYVIKSGFLLKRGGNFKNWKRRYFTVRNKAENFVIIYSEDETGLDVKGQINCFGYQVEIFSDEDVTKHGAFGFKLISYDGSKRCWWLRADNEEDQSQWMEVFSYACRNSVMKVDSDQFQEQAFKLAYRMTRMGYGYFGAVRVLGTEVEMLESIISQILRREILDEHIARITDNSSAQSAQSKIAAVDTQVQSIVTPIVASTWRSCEAVCTMRKTFQKSVEENLEALHRIEKEIYDKFLEKTCDLVDPVLSDLEPQLNAVLLALRDGITRAYENALRSFHDIAHGHLELLAVNPNEVEKVMSAADASIMLLHAGPLDSAQKSLWTMFTEDLNASREGTVHEFLESTGVGGYNIYCGAMDDLRALLRNAFYTFQEMVKQEYVQTESAGKLVRMAPPRHVVEVLNDTISKVNADAKAFYRKTILTVLHDLVESSVQELLYPSVYELMIQAKPLVPKPLAGTLNVNFVGERMTESLIERFLTAVAENLLVDASSRFNMVALQIKAHAD